MLQNWKKIMLLAIPSLISFATATLTGTVSLIMVGDLGFVVIAVVGVTNIIMYNAFAIFSGIGHTVNYLVAQNYGAGDMKKGIERTYLAFYMCIIFALLIALVGWTMSSELLRWIGGPKSGNLVNVGTEYLEIRFYAMSFGIISFAFHGFLRGIGSTTLSMVIALISNLIMIFLVYALTFGTLGFPNLGLRGTGLAILIGEAIQVAICAYVYFFVLNKRFATRILVRIKWPEFRLLAFESGKLGMQEFSLSLSMFIFTVFVARLGERALAANEIALNVMSFGFMPAFAFGATATILVGQYVGQGKAILGRRAGTDTAILGTIFLILLGTAEFFFAEQIARIYSNDVQVYELAAYLIKISAFLQIFDGLLNFFAGGLRGLGDTTFLLFISLAVSWLLFVPLSYLFIFVLGWGSLGAWLALYTFLAVFGLAVTFRFYRTDWSAVKLREASPH
ncbi:MATE family efflux transporter [Paenibacillus abyssi]|uniref:Probable multidrug resistance protein NorM n=1 Tax=Paenibacillus abyssi TaxID=1340531 RepID=A0A917CSS5_9BACL|nr:MATE family efflux transporter [Paenibacillus abyssi]GGF97370.1 MATE family efflux transporter [Paenibacillus abyssi]